MKLIICVCVCVCVRERERKRERERGRAIFLVFFALPDGSVEAYVYSIGRLRRKGIYFTTSSKSVVCLIGTGFLLYQGHSTLS